MPSFDPNEFIISENDAQKLQEDYISEFGTPDDTNNLSHFILFPKELLQEIATNYDKEEVTHFKINLGCTQVDINNVPVTKLTVFVSPAGTNGVTGKIEDLTGGTYNWYNRGNICPSICD